MSALGVVCTKAGGLTSLRSFTSTIHRKGLTEAWINAIELFLKVSPIEVFQSYVPFSDSIGALADTLCVRVVNQHRDHLVRFFSHRQCIGLSAVEHVCVNCPRLEELFVAIQYAEMVYISFPPTNPFTKGSLGTPYTDPCQGNASTHSTDLSRRPTARVGSSRVCIGHRSPMQSNNFPSCD